MIQFPHCPLSTQTMIQTLTSSCPALTPCPREVRKWLISHLSMSVSQSTDQSSPKQWTLTERKLTGSGFSVELLETSVFVWVYINHVWGNLLVTVRAGLVDAESCLLSFLPTIIIILIVFMKVLSGHFTRKKNKPQEPDFLSSHCTVWPAVVLQQLLWNCRRKL